MKAKTKLLGVVCLASLIAVITTAIVVAGPDNGYPDEPIGIGSGAGPENGYPDEPIGYGMGGAPENGYPDEPIGYGMGGAPENGYPDEPIGGFAAA